MWGGHDEAEQVEDIEERNRRLQEGIDKIMATEQQAKKQQASLDSQVEHLRQVTSLPPLSLPATNLSPRSIPVHGNALPTWHLSQICGAAYSGCSWCLCSSNRLSLTRTRPHGQELSAAHNRIQRVQQIRNTCKRLSCVEGKLHPLGAKKASCAGTSLVTQGLFSCVMVRFLFKLPVLPACRRTNCA
jgi:hypothetical protein